MARKWIQMRRWMTDHVPYGWMEHLSQPEAQAVYHVFVKAYDGHYTQASTDAAVGAAKLGEMNRGMVLVPFTKAEIRVLWAAIGNGAEGVLQPSSGFSPAQKRAFKQAANRLHKAGKITLPSM